jgi:hypothetical protein
MPELRVTADERLLEYLDEDDEVHGPPPLLASSRGSCTFYYCRRGSFRP